MSRKNSDQKSHTGKVPRLLRLSAPGGRQVHGVRLYAVAIPERASITDRDTAVRTDQRSRLNAKNTDETTNTNESQRRKTPMITARVNIPFEQYKECFVKNYQCPYIIQQKPGSPWKTVNKNISDDVILAHLDGTIWAGVRAPWYITYGIIDFDCPENDIVRNTVEHLHMRASEYMLVTSPSFWQDGSVHLIFPIEYNEALTSSRYQKLFAEYMTGEFSGIEIYPHPHRPIRLPFGKNKNQYIIDDYGAPLDMSWQDRLYWFSKLDPYNITILEKLLSHLKDSHQNTFPVNVTTDQSEAADLYHNGLKQFGTRHHATLNVTYLLLSQGHSQGETGRLMRKWIREKHNGFSREMNRNNLRQVDKEIDDAIDWIWNRYTHTTVMGTSDTEFYVYECDIPFITECFRGKVSDQKHLFKLIGYARPRYQYDWISCSKKTWIKIAGNRYTRFIRKLDKKKIIERSKSYRTSAYPKGIRIALPDASQSSPLMNGTGFVNDFRDAVRIVCPTKEEAVSLLGLSKSTVAEWYRSDSYEIITTYKDSKLFPRKSAEKEAPPGQSSQQFFI